jgi:hypothetical protein
MITGAAQMDGAILVVSATDGPMPLKKLPQGVPKRFNGNKAYKSFFNIFTASALSS